MGQCQWFNFDLTPEEEWSEFLHFEINKGEKNAKKSKRTWFLTQNQQILH